MRRLLSLLALSLALAACTSGENNEVRNSNDRLVGTLEVSGPKTAMIMNTHGETLGKVRGTVIRDMDGKQIGTIVEADGHVEIQDINDQPLGTVVNGTDCYGKGQEKLGTIDSKGDAYVAAGACRIFFLE